MSEPLNEPLNEPLFSASEEEEEEETPVQFTNLLGIGPVGPVERPILVVPPLNTVETTIQAQVHVVRVDGELEREARRRRVWGVYAVRTLGNRLYPNLVRLVATMAPTRYMGDRTLPDANASIFKVHIHNDTGVVVTRDGRIYTMDLRTGQFWTQPGDHRNRFHHGIRDRVKAVAFHPSRPWVFLAGWRHRNLAIIQYPDPQSTPVFLPVPHTLSDDVHVATHGLSVCETSAAILGTAGNVHILDFGQGPEGATTTRQLTFERGPCTFLKIDGASRDTLVVWRQISELGSGSLVQKSSLGPTRTETQFHGCDSRLVDLYTYRDMVVAATQKTVLLWSGGGAPLHKFRRHHKTIQSLTLVPGRGIAVTTSFDKTIRFWDLDNECELMDDVVKIIWRTGSKKPQSVAVSRDGWMMIGYDTKHICLRQF